MADVHDSETRRRNMAAIRGADTKPELEIRRRLHALGFRYRLHDRKLPGRPDLVFPMYRAALFVNGCFWHGHDCDRFRWPKTSPEFWHAKICSNVGRDLRNEKALGQLGWRVGIVWECAIKGPGRLPPENLDKKVAVFLTGTEQSLWVQGSVNLGLRGHDELRGDPNILRRASQSA
ncbi:very short patch repair endonuclease [Ruegeria aquimaris]|uniref:Very short patch repair endonuclease n=1 Tax=Ruegeria aquimaris TaxID=2984333 RepID=A0ABT3ALB9_9RHOB|nr:very short patch repair endonuclease [Ruegeria sp. XHP0148]MCV2889444.1 very short patch repair endonuclease [Ruegeria sp. XHP0148]